MSHAPVILFKIGRRSKTRFQSTIFKGPPFLGSVFVIEGMEGYFLAIASGLVDDEGNSGGKWLNFYN
jgi:hypothetical protein